MDRYVDPVIVAARAHRIAHGLTQKAVAQRIGWDIQTVSRLETGHTQPLVATLRKYLTGVGLDLTTREVT